MTENIHYKRVQKRADASRQAAAEALDNAEKIPGGNDPSTYARIAALQAQAQIDVLHMISYDLANIEAAPDRR